MKLPDLAAIDHNVTRTTQLTWSEIEYMLRVVDPPITLVTSRSTRKLLDEAVRMVPLELLLSPEWVFRVEVDASIPKGTFLFIAPQLEGETETDWAARCGKITDAGTT